MPSDPILSLKFPGLMHQPSHVSTEINLIWAKENPDLFLKAVADFRDQTEGWGQKINIERTGFITLHASRHPDYSESKPEKFSVDVVKAHAADWLLAGNQEARKENLRAVLADICVSKVADLKDPEDIIRVAELIGLS